LTESSWQRQHSWPSNGNGNGNAAGGILACISYGAVPVCSISTIEWHVFELGENPAATRKAAVDDGKHFGSSNGKRDIAELSTSHTTQQLPQLGKETGET
jgi:hypothetical protein